MNLPKQEWEPVGDWAARNNWTLREALKHALSHNCIEWGGHVVRYVPDLPTRQKWVKISKSDQP